MKINGGRKRRKMSRDKDLHDILSGKVIGTKEANDWKKQTSLEREKRERSKISQNQKYSSFPKQYNKDKARSLCMAPWTHLHAWPNGKVFQCCSAQQDPDDEYLGNLHKESLENIWNGKMMRSIRKDMMKGIRSPHCKKCWDDEDTGNQSLRMMLNHRFGHHGPELIAKTKESGRVKDMTLRYWDFRFSNVCNFKCRSCGPELSSGWAKDHTKRNELLGYPIDVKDLTKPDRLAMLWEQIEPSFPYVEEIYFAGGESLMMEEHYRILERLIKMGKTEVRLNYNTNFSKLQFKSKDVIELWKHFPEVHIGASFDDYGKRAELIRSGTVWSEIEDNVKRLKKELPDIWKRFFVSCTVSIQNVYNLPEFHKYLLDTGMISYHLNFFCNILHGPDWLNIKNLPDWMKDEIEEKLLSYEKFDFSGVVNFMREQPTGDLYEITPRFISNMDTLDTIRHERWRHIMPELRHIAKRPE